MKYVDFLENQEIILPQSLLSLHRKSQITVYNTVKPGKNCKILSLNEEKDPFFVNNYVSEELKEQDIDDLSPKKMMADYGIAKIDRFSQLLTEVIDEKTFKKFIGHNNTWIQGNWYGKRKTCYKNPF